MKFIALALSLLIFITMSSAYELKQSRDQMLTYYYTYIDEKIPKSARVLIGNERVNTYVGGKIIGAEVINGQLHSFEFSPVENPTISIYVGDDAAEKIAKRQMGILAAVESGGIRISANNLASLFKIEALKRIYAVAKIDDQIMGKKKISDFVVYNSIYVQKARFWNSMFYAG